MLRRPKDSGYIVETEEKRREGGRQTKAELLRHMFMSIIVPSVEGLSYPVGILAVLLFTILPSLHLSSILQSSQPASKRDIIVVSHSSSPRSHLKPMAVPSL